MKKYIVGMKELTLQLVRIEAENKEDAIMKVQDGDGEYLDSPEILDTFDFEDWSVKEET